MLYSEPAPPCLRALAWNQPMANSSLHPARKTASTASIVLSFACVYFFWGSTFTAIRIGATQMPPLLLAGTRFFIAGAILLAWCRWRGLRLLWPPRTMLILGLVGFFLLSVNNVALVYAEKTISSGLASLLMASIPLFVALAEMMLPRGEPLSVRGWLGIVLGFAGLAALMWPSLRTGFAGDYTRLVAIGVLLAGALAWAVGSILSRHAARNRSRTMARLPRESGFRRLAGLAYHRRFARRLLRLHLFTGARAGGQGLLLLLCEPGGRGAAGNRSTTRTPGAS